MENDIYNETKQISKITENVTLEELILKKKILFNNSRHISLNDCSNTIESSCHTASSQKYTLLNLKHGKENIINKLQLKTNLNIIFSQEELNQPNIRKDNFGNEIKKGGKHKIIFADDLKLKQSLMENDSLGNNKKRTQEFSPSRNLEKEISPIIRTVKRSNTFKNKKASTIKSFYKIFKKNLNNTKILYEPLVNIINIKCIKEETKANTYIFRNNIKSAEEEQVCCSCYCSIY